MERNCATRPLLPNHKSAMPAPDLTFRDELRDFLRFLLRPKLSPRLPATHHNNGQLPGISFKRLLQWALALWAINLLVMGPIALTAAQLGGVQHRMDLTTLPWLHALIWAPLVEELVFRYGLRQPVRALWLLPFALPALLMGPGSYPALLLTIGILLCVWLHGRDRHTPGNTNDAHLITWMPALRWHKTYCRHFGWIMHASCLVFAAMHLYNFALNAMPWWLMPLLVTPQWVTGLALAWQRTRRNLPTAVILHALFNAAPLLLVFTALKLLGEMA